MIAKEMRKRKKMVSTIANVCSPVNRLSYVLKCYKRERSVTGCVESQGVVPPFFSQAAVPIQDVPLPVCK